MILKLNLFHPYICVTSIDGRYYYFFFVSILVPCLPLYLPNDAVCCSCYVFAERIFLWWSRNHLLLFICFTIYVNFCAVFLLLRIFISFATHFHVAIDVSIQMLFYFIDDTIYSAEMRSEQEMAKMFTTCALKWYKFPFWLCVAAAINFSIFHFPCIGCWHFQHKFVIMFQWISIETQ